MAGACLYHPKKIPHQINPLLSIAGNNRERRMQDIITRDFVAHLKGKIEANASFDNHRLTKEADRFFRSKQANTPYTSREAYDALEAAANQWLLQERAKILMRSPAIKAIHELRTFTRRLPTQSDKSYEQIDLQQFSTPPPLAYVAVRLLSPQPGELIIDPSAGTGSLIIWAHATEAKVICNEIAPRRRALLELLGFETHAVDAELLEDLLPADIKPAGIVMNPPFSTTQGRDTRHDTMYGARHVEAALRRLEKTGRLVAITSPAMATSASRFTEWWRRIACGYNIRASVIIGGREFAKSGTGVDAHLIVIDKDGPTPGRHWEEQLENIKRGRLDSLEEAWEKLKNLTLREPREFQVAEDKPPAQVFVPYHVSQLAGGRPHPALVVESASMAAISPPIITYRPVLPTQAVEEGALSLLQVERIIRAGQRHEQRLPDGARCGFYIGDGTGVGKGRSIAGIILDNWNQERRRIIWLSSSNTLMNVARVDLSDIGAGDIPLDLINNYPATGEITLLEGVIFCSYSTLGAESKNGKRRIDQIERWLGPDGLIIIDEASDAIHGAADGSRNPTKSGQAVIELQNADKNPEYRIIYSSATGATKLRDMGYATRLGLWGPGTSFPIGFRQFLKEIESGGIGAIEMLIRDLKALGSYLSASIGFGVCPKTGKAVEFREVNHDLTPEDIEMYNRAAAAWSHLLKKIDEAIRITGSGPHTHSRVMSRYWGAQQTFFLRLISALKASTVITETEKALAEGKSVVISLIGTDESQTRKQVEHALASGTPLEDLDLSPRRIITQTIERVFPTAVPFQWDDNGEPKQSPEALEIKKQLLNEISALQLPQNPIDRIISHFGEGNVAELTGRTRRPIRDSNTGKLAYKKRAPEGVPLNQANNYEMRQFQSGKKRIAIISGASSKGISLHASNREANRQRRVHITLETAWSPITQMQFFGRTHRSDQAIPPEFVLVSTNIGGDKRFISTIASRLKQLGALTKGDRSAADSGDWGKYDFHIQEGREALRLMYRGILQGDDVPGLDDSKQTLRDMGLVTRDSKWNEIVERENDVPHFLNRLLGLNIDLQNAMFDHFTSTFNRAVSAAKATGTFDDGLTDIHASAIRFACQPRVVATDTITGAETKHYVLDVDQTAPTLRFDEADRERQEKGGVFLRHNKKGHVILALPSRLHTDPETGETYKTFAVKRPEGRRCTYLSEEKLTRKFMAIDLEDARGWWISRCEELPAVETKRIHLIAGVILGLWQRLKAKGSGLQIVRLTTQDGRRIVGAQIPEEQVGAVLRALGIKHTPRSPKEIFHAIRRDYHVAELTTGLKIIRTLVRNEERIEMFGLKYNHHAPLRNIGLIEESSRGYSRFFIPTEPEAGVAVLTELLKAYPQIKSAEDAKDDDARTTEELEAEGEAPTIDLRTWLIPPKGTPPVISVSGPVEPALARATHGS
jgi:tRNA G10  N-methylase Trm11